MQNSAQTIYNLKNPSIAMAATSLARDAAATVLGYPAEAVTAVATIILAIATVALAVPTMFLALAAWKQLPILVQQIKDAKDAAGENERSRREDRAIEEWHLVEANTLRACERYFSNPTIVQASKRVFEKTNNGTTYLRDENFKTYEHDLITVLNYLNGLGVGVEQGIFSGDIIKDHIYNTVVKVVDTIIPALITQPAKYQALLNLRQNWKITNPSYKRNPNS